MPSISSPRVGGGGEENWKSVLNKLDVFLSILPVSPFAKVGGDDDDGRAFAVLSSW